MVDSRTKQRVIQRHRSNDLLQDPLLAAVQQSETDLSVDQPTMELDPDVVQETVEALKAGNTHYAPVPGVESLREALANHVNSGGLSAYESEDILVTAGVQEARFLSLQKVGEMFDCVAMPEVVDPGVRKAAAVRQLDVRFLPVDTETGMLLTLRTLEEALHDGCRLFYLELPARISGAFYNPCTVDAVADLFESFGASVILDQGLKPWASDECVSLASLPGMASRTVALGEVWPGVGLEGLMIGYIAARGEWWEHMRSQKQIQSICTSTASQFAAIKAAEVYGRVHETKASELMEKRREALELMPKLDAQALTGGAVNVIGLQLSRPEHARMTLREHGYCFANGADFGAPHAIRLSVTYGGTVIEALDELTQPIGRQQV